MLSRFSRSMTTIANLQRMSAKTLSEKILAEQGASPEDSAIAIIDVRDNGRLPFLCLRCPFSKTTYCLSVDNKRNELANSVVQDYLGGHIKGSTNVPIHQLDAMMPTLLRRLRDKKTVVFHCMLSQQRGPGAALRYIREREDNLRAQGGTPKDKQVVYVLDLGFSGWQQTYAEDERLTEGYRKELWGDGD